ncbi:hypothetical protein pb186bvf_017603 [Paramecium bursaria]
MNGISDFLSYQNQIEEIKFSIYMVIMLLVFIFFWTPYLNNLSKQIWRTKVMKNIIFLGYAQYDTYGNYIEISKFEIKFHWRRYPLSRKKLFIYKKIKQIKINRQNINMGNETSHHEKIDFLQPTINQIKEAPQQITTPPPPNTEWRIGLQHPHLLQTLGGQQEGTQYRYFFEFCSITLQSLLQERYGTKKYFPEEDLQAMMLGICSALSFLQEKGISHGDICPSEIYFDAQSSSFKILDSNLINGRAAATQQVLAGKFKTISPECYQSLGRPMTEIQLHKNDVWMLGMVMLEASVLKTNDPIYTMGIQPYIINERIQEIAQIYNATLAENIALMLNFKPEERPDPVNLFNYLLEQQRLAQEIIYTPPQQVQQVQQKPQYQQYQQPSYPQVERGQQERGPQYQMQQRFDQTQAQPQQPPQQRFEQSQIPQQRFEQTQVPQQRFEQIPQQRFEQTQLPPQQRFEQTQTQQPLQQRLEQTQIQAPQRFEQTQIQAPQQRFEQTQPPQQRFEYRQEQPQQSRFEQTQQTYNPQQMAQQYFQQYPPTQPQQQVPPTQTPQYVQQHPQYMNQTLPRSEPTQQNLGYTQMRQNHQLQTYVSQENPQPQVQAISRERYNGAVPRQVIKKLVYPDGRVEYKEQSNSHSASRINPQQQYQQHPQAPRVLGNIENQVERNDRNPQISNEQNIYRLKQEIEQSKTLIQQYQNPKPQQQNQAESIEERIKKVIAQSQALRENFA